MCSAIKSKRATEENEENREREKKLAAKWISRRWTVGIPFRVAVVVVVVVIFFSDGGGQSFLSGFPSGQRSVAATGRRRRLRLLHYRRPFRHGRPRCY